MDFYPPPSEECPPSRSNMKSWEDGYPHYESMDHSPSINQNMLSSGQYVPASPTSSLTGSFFNPFSYGYPPPPPYSSGGMEGFTSFSQSSLTTSSPSMSMQTSYSINSSPPSTTTTTTVAATKEESTTDAAATLPSTLLPPSSTASTPLSATEQQAQQQQPPKPSKESKRAKKKNISFDKLNISDLINENELDADTLSAQKAERDRMERILSAQKRAQQESQQRAALLRQQQEYHRRLQQVQRVPEYGSPFPMDQQRAFFSHSGASSHHLKVPKSSRLKRAQHQEPRFPKSQTWVVPNLPSSSPSQQQSPKESNAAFSSSLPSPSAGGANNIESPPHHQVKTSPSSWVMPSMQMNEVASSHSNPPLSQEESSSSSHNQEFAHSPASSSTSNPPSKSIDALPPPLTQEASPASPPLSSPSSTSCSSTHSASQAAFDSSNIKKEPFDSSMHPPETGFFHKPQVDQSPKRTLQQQNVLLNRQLDGFLGSSPNVKSFGGKRERYPPFYPQTTRSTNKEVILIDSSEEEDEGSMKAKESQDIKRIVKKKEVIDVSSGSEMGEDRRPRTKPGLMVPIKDEPVSGEEDDDVVMLSNEEESESESSNDENDMSGSHINDFYNQIDAEGRVLVNVGHPSEDPDIFLAPQITRAIKPHQVGGIRFLWDNVVENLERFRTSPGFGCILAHSMGLGKTVQVISFIDVFLTHTGSKHVVCVVPINTIQNWKTEFDMWTPPKHMVHEMYIQSGEVRPRNYETFILNDNYRTLSARTELIRSWHERGGVMLMGYEMYRMLALKQVPKTKKKTKQEAEADSNEVLNKQYFDEIHKALVDPGPDLIICDEGHRIKNASANTSQALKNIRTKRRVVLTGYPLQNSLLEYWCMVDFIRPNYLGSKAEFCNMFERPITNGQCIDSTPRDRQLMRFRSHVLHSLLQGFVQRRGHSVLRASLPNKDEHVILIRMSEIQRKLYKAFVSDLLTVQNAVNPLKLFAVCCKIWNHPDILYDMLQNQRQIVQGDDNDLDIDVALQATKPGRKNNALRKKDPNKNGFIQDPAIPPYRDKTDPSINYDWMSNPLKNRDIPSFDQANPLMADYIPGQLANSYKLTIMFAILEQTLAAGDKILVFSQSLFTLSLIEKFLSVREVPYRPPGMPPEKWARNKNYYRLDGSTNAQDREKMIQDFNGNPNIVLFLLSTRAGCLGINLIGANRIIVLDASWNPCHDAQAVCRIYRYGQMKPCFIYRLITDNSLEKRIYDRQINKQGMSDRVVDELTPECNFTMKEVNTLTHENEEDNPVKDYSEVVDTFNDHILKYIYSNFNYCLSKEPFEHESLLSDRKDLKLTKQEKRMAKKSYEMEKRANMHNYRGASHAGFMPSSVNISPNLIRPWLLPSQATPSMQDGSKTGGMLGNLLKPGCSVQKIKVPQDVTIPVTTPGLPPVHIKAGQEVLVMKTPKGMCLQLPGGRLVAIHFNPATLGGGDKGMLDGKGKPIMPMKNRIVQPSLHCGGMVRMRPGSSVLKRPTEVINLSDDNDSDVESPKTIPSKPSISITPVSASSSASQPSSLIKQQPKKPMEGPGEKKWPSSLSNLNLPSNLSVSILPVSTSTKTASTTSSSSPSSAKLIKLNSGERSSLPGLPSGIDVSILSSNKARQQPPQQHKISKPIPPTSASISLLPKSQTTDTDVTDKSPLANIPAGVSILPFSKPSSSNKSPPNVTLFPKSDQTNASKGLPSNLDISIYPSSSKQSDVKHTSFVPSDKAMSPNNLNSMTGMEDSAPSGEAAPNLSDQILDKETNLTSENLSLEMNSFDPKSDNSAQNKETFDFNKEINISQKMNIDSLNHTSDKGRPIGNDDATPEASSERKDERSLTSELKDAHAPGSLQESLSSNNTSFTSKDGLSGTGNEINYGQSSGAATAGSTQIQDHPETSHHLNPNDKVSNQSNEPVPSQQQQFSMPCSETSFPSQQANRAAYSSFSQGISPSLSGPAISSHSSLPSDASMSYKHSSLGQSQPPDVNQYFDQYSCGSQNKNAHLSTPSSNNNNILQTSITGTASSSGQQENQHLTSNENNHSFSIDNGIQANMSQSKMSSSSHLTNVNFQQSSQVPSHMAQAGTTKFTNDSFSSSQVSQVNSHSQITQGKSTNKSRKSYKKNANKASNKSNNTYPSGMNNSQLFNPLSWQNVHLEEGNNLSSNQYANQGTAQANVYNQKSYDNTSWGTAYQMGSESGQPPSNKSLTSEGFGNWQMDSSGNQETGVDSGNFQRNAPPPTSSANMADISSSFNSSSSWPVSSSISTSSSDNLLTNTWVSNSTGNTSQQSFQGQAWGNANVSGASAKNIGDQTPELQAKPQQSWGGFENQQSGTAPVTATSEWSGSSTSYLNLDSEKGSTSSAPGSSSLADWFHDTELGFGTNWSNPQEGTKTSLGSTPGNATQPAVTLPNTSESSSETASFWSDSFTTLLQESANSGGADASWTGQYNNWAGGNENRDWATYNNATSTGNTANDSAAASTSYQPPAWPNPASYLDESAWRGGAQQDLWPSGFDWASSQNPDLPPPT